jgi:hypothetical protein
MIALLLAASAAAQCPGPECRMMSGLALAVDGYDYKADVYGPGGDEFLFSIYTGNGVRHEADPETPLAVRDTWGRVVRSCRTHAISEVVIVGGMPPREFDRLVALNLGPYPRDRPLDYPSALVRRGLGCDLYHTREAAQGCLIRMGPACVPACLAGLESADAEVRQRCAAILDEIRNGPTEMLP